MPIPSRFVRVNVFTPAPPRQTPTVELRGGNGDTISLTGASAGFEMQSERGLFGLTDPGLILRDSAGDGSRWAGSRRAAKTIDLNLRIRGDSGVEFRSRMARLADVLDDRYGIATLRAITDTSTRELPVLFSAGWGGDGSGFLWQDVAFTLTAPDPYWRDATPQTLVWRTGGSKPLLSPTVPFFPVQLASAQVLGTVDVNNPGNVAGPGVWTITGPANGVTVAPEPSLRGFSIASPIAAGTVLTLDGDAGTLVDQTGANRYDLLGPAPKVWKIPPGQSTASVVAASATSATSITLTWFPRYKLAA